jgi:acetyltransferase-like isoleucine patch superfamily enzyme
MNRLTGILGKIKTEVYELIEMVFGLVSGYIGRILRYYFYRIFLKKLGSKVVISTFVKIQCPGNVEIGDGVQINVGTIIAANSVDEGLIVIGDDVLIGHGVIIHSGNHNYKTRSVKIKNQGHNFSKIIIGNDVWVGAKSIILSGVNIAEGAVFAAGSVVTKDASEFTVNAGVPSKRIAERC